MSTPPKSVNELKEILAPFKEALLSWVHDQLDGTSYYGEALEGIEKLESDTVAAINKLYISREAVLEAVPPEAIRTPHSAQSTWATGWNECRKKFLDKLKLGDE